ncbi:MAG: outer membrane beta-barrel protein [Bacteroidetes bacterium]|nr:outer membrane beta-barrel protein [Bacteroidota bacterium]
MRWVLFFFCLVNFKFIGHTQDSALKNSILATRFYVDAYFTYDFSRPITKERAPFLYNHKRHNELNVNLVLASISFKSKAARANFGLMAGTYSMYNLSNEPVLLRHLFEGNAGIKISKKKNIWLDIGTMPSHIGFESAISKECWTPTRSILAENTPYYETGVRFSYTSRDEKLYAAALVLNGWQRIRILKDQLMPAFGTQITYKPNNKLSINWSTFLGNIKPDSISQWRYLNNFYALYQPTKSFGITVGFDHGFEKNYPVAKNFNVWYSPVLIIRFESKEWIMAARMEYYNDKTGIIVPLVNNQSFSMQGYSLNIDRKILRNSLWRLEWRYFNNSSPYFLTSNRYVSNNHAVTTSLLCDFLRN